MADYPSPHIHLPNKMDRNPQVVLNPVTCITHLLHPHSQIPLLHQRESVVNYPTPLLHPHAQLPKPSLSTLHQPTLHHLESQVALIPDLSSSSSSSSEDDDVVLTGTFPRKVC